MRLINVQVFLDLDEGRKVNPDENILKDHDDHQSSDTKYAILSHCWGDANDEVQFREMEGLTKMATSMRKKFRQRHGYQKILEACKQARQDQLKWLWVDTCCINKESSSELSEAINSMFRWYESSEKCYVYLHDVQSTRFPTEPDKDRYHVGGRPKWFSRGWTLQELVAPSIVQFFNQDWHLIGDKRTHSRPLSEITRIPTCILQYGLEAYRPSAAQIMSWAADRVTTRMEDRAYSLLGLFGVHLPMLYGEGKLHAFRRLQLEIIRTTNDHSIFAWDRELTGWSGSVLADEPDFFRHCDDVVKMEPEEYLVALKEEVPENELRSVPEETIRTYSVTNSGIHIWLPLKRCRGSQSIFEARLACRRSFDTSPMPIILMSFKSNYYRYFGHFQAINGTTAQFKPLYLAYREETRRRDFTFRVDDRAITCAGFIQRCVFPRRINPTANSITLSSTNHCAIIVYANNSTRTCFVIVLGYCLGHEWVHVVFSPLPDKGIYNLQTEISDPWCTYAEKVYNRIWSASPEDAYRIAQATPSTTAGLHGSGLCLVKHAHLPQSIKGVQIFYQRLPQPNTCLVTIDVAQCAGCCVAPDVWQTLDGLVTDGPETPGLMMDGTSPRIQAKRNAEHAFLVDGAPARFASTLARPEIKLGDYGRDDGHSFKPEGNIFEGEHLLALGLHVHASNAAFRPVEHTISHGESSNIGTNTMESVALNRCLNQWEGLLMRHPKCLSLPVNQEVLALLKSLSTPLEGKCLVTMVIKCSECYGARAQGIIGMSPTWPKQGEYHTDSGRWNKLPASTPLFISTKPLLWRGEQVDSKTRACFEDIRNHFRTLMYPHMRRTVGDSGKFFIDKEDALKVCQTPISFFRNIFGGGRFKDYVGDITFFELTNVVGGNNGEAGAKVTGLRSPFVTQSGHTAADHLNSRTTESNSTDSQCPPLHAHSVNGEQIEAVDYPRVVNLAEILMERMSVAISGCVDEKLQAAQKTELHRNLEELRSASFGMELLRIIGITYQKSLEGKQIDNVDDVRRNIRSLVEEVRTLEGKLVVCEDEDEERALEEDITGKILLACWLGIRSEIEQVLTKVVALIIDDEGVDQNVRKQRLLREIRKIFKRATDDVSDDGQGHLRR
ncbi:hypothetical protein ID866_5294 [Astraeus odoratus]|nr:hypothetical protein ID866_5294 [Astraeus odoratus]